LWVKYIGKCLSEIAENHLKNITSEKSDQTLPLQQNTINGADKLPKDLIEQTELHTYFENKNARQFV
jgi:hypothetical protein